MNALELSPNKEASLVYRYFSDVFWSVAPADCSLALVTKDLERISGMRIAWDEFCLVPYIRTLKVKFTLYQATKAQRPN
jgi:hypothetical protein